MEFCQDQNGSRFIQQRLEVAGTQEKELVMSEVLPSVRILRNDVFGNYVVQKLFEHGTARMRTQLRDTLEGEMLALSVQMYGWVIRVCVSIVNFNFSSVPQKGSKTFFRTVFVFLLHKLA